MNYSCSNSKSQIKKPQNSRRMEMSIDVEELQLFDGIAACANHTVNFKIVENEVDMISNN